MDTWQSDGGEDSDGEIVEIISVEEYDGEKAKALASLSWVLCKAYQDQVPTEFHDPFYINGEGAWQIKPRLANLLASSELYCQACRNMFGENASQWAGHWSIIQVLSRKGIYAVGSDSNDVTETILMQSAPFKLKAHLALIDALMKAFCGEIMSVERVTQTVRRFSSFNASSELPNDSEEAVLFWVNKVCATVQRKLQESWRGETGEKGQDEYNQSSSEPPSVPMLLRLVEDIGDGCSVASLLSFHCPGILRIEDVCLKSNVGIADSLYNLRLIKSFCERHLPYKTWHFTFEDLLYTHENLKLNIMMMIAELFYWFEIRTLPIVTGAGLTAASEGGHTSAAASWVPSVPISNVTKQSFQRHKVDAQLRCSSAPDAPRLSPSAPLPHRAAPLLHKRQQQGGVPGHDGHGNTDVRQAANRVGGPPGRPRGVPLESVVAWPEKCQPYDIMTEGGNGEGMNMLANVSIDSDMNASFSSGSIDLGDLDSSPRLHSDRSRSDCEAGHVISFSLQNKKGTPFPSDLKRLDLESVNSVNSHVEAGFEVNRTESEQFAFGSNTDILGTGNLEPLFPAKLKQAKEKTSFQTKEEERGEVPKQKTVSPTSKTQKAVTIDPQSTVIKCHSYAGAHDIKLPLESQVSTEEFNSTNAETDPSPRKFEAFFVRGSVDSSVDLPSHRSDVTVAESYVIDHVHTPEAARAAGIPIIEMANQTPRSLETANQMPRTLETANHSPGTLKTTNQTHRPLSREGSVASSKSSGEFSDHESQKIHADHKTQESFRKQTSGDVGTENMVDTNDPANFIIRKPVIVSRPPKPVDFVNKIPSTTFSQIKQLRNVGNVDNAGFVYMQHGQDETHKPSSLKDTFQKKQQEKKSPFGSSPVRQPAPNSTQPLVGENEASADVPADNAAAGQELLKIKMKLEEKRKAIERKKHTQEIQQQKIRQRLGKAAFLHVVRKPNDGSGNTMETQATNGTAEMATTLNNVRTAAQSPRSVNALDGIRQTIENVRNNWFNTDDPMSQKDGDHSESESPESGVNDSDVRNSDMSSSQESQGSQQGRRLVFDRRSASVERVSSLAEQRLAQHETVQGTRNEENRSNITEQSVGVSNSSVFSQQNVPSPQKFSVENTVPTVDQSNTFVARQSRSDLRKKSDIKPERHDSYDEYSNSLDKLNQSLTDLQGEIMKLSLKKEQQSVSRSRSKSPTMVESKAFKEQETKSVETVGRMGLQSAQAQHKSRSSSEPRQLASEGQHAGNYASLPRPPNYAQGQPQMQPYAMQSPTTMAGQIGPIYGTHGHFMQSPGQQYPSYVMGPTPPMGQGNMPQMRAQFQPSPPGYHTGPPGMYPTQQFPGPHNLVSPHSTVQPVPYSTIYTSPTIPSTQFQPMQQMPGSYTTPTHMQYMPQGMQPSMFDTQQAYVQQQLSSVQNPVNYPETVQLRSSHKVEDRDISCDSTRSFTALTQVSEANVLQSSRSNYSDKQFKKVAVSDKSDSGVTKTSSSNSYGSSVISDFATQVNKPRGSFTGQEEVQGSSTGPCAAGGSSNQATDVTAVGFVVGEDDTSLDQSAEEEMQRKKEKLEKMRLKRLEEQERKRLKLEQDMNRRREAERLKQEESERRKSEEKARREAIFKQYITNKEEDEEGPKREKPKQKTRPKSMFVKAGPELVEGFEGGGSAEDMSVRAMSASVGPEPGSTAQFSMNTLHNGSGDARSLAYGGLTHRRPLSPDPNKTRKGQRSNESSESGSSHDVEYAGPKLFVKPSSKSNRHIMINAISHCCLAGSVNTEQKNKVLEEIAKSCAKHFIILFRDSSCGYRGLYGFDPDTEDCFKIVGVGPRSIHNDMVEKYFKYNSGGKSFSEVVSTKHISVSIDAVCLQNSVWKPNKPPAKALR